MNCDGIKVLPYLNHCSSEYCLKEFWYDLVDLNGRRWAMVPKIRREGTFTSKTTTCNNNIKTETTRELFSIGERHEVEWIRIKRYKPYIQKEDPAF